MISINRYQVDTLSKQPNSKQQFGKQDLALYPIFAHSQINTNDVLRNFSTYEMAHWINYSDRWLSNRTGSTNIKSYRRGTIVFIDLGAGNFGHEPSFTHPGVVLAQNKDSILIAPCSSKKYGKGYPEIVDATSVDGFSSNTGIQTSSIRWISKNRVISSIGSTTSDILNKIDTLLLKSIPLHTRIIIDKDHTIAALEENQSILNAENQILKEEIEKLKSELQQLKETT